MRHDIPRLPARRMVEDCMKAMVVGVAAVLREELKECRALGKPTPGARICVLRTMRAGLGSRLCLIFNASASRVPPKLSTW